MGKTLMDRLESLSVNEIEREFFNRFILGNHTGGRAPEPFFRSPQEREAWLEWEDVHGGIGKLSEDDTALFWHFFKRVFPENVGKPQLAWLRYLEEHVAQAGRRVECIHGCKVPPHEPYFWYIYSPWLSQPDHIKICFNCMGMALWVAHAALYGEAYYLTNLQQGAPGWEP